MRDNVNMQLYMCIQKAKGEIKNEKKKNNSRRHTSTMCGTILISFVLCMQVNSYTYIYILTAIR